MAIFFCLFRWVNALDPKIDKGPWTPQQDRKLLENIDKFGKGEGEHCVTFQESSVKVAPYSFLKIAKKNDYLYDCLLPWQQSTTY